MTRLTLTVSALACCIFCASCATVNQKADTAAPAALEEERLVSLTVGDPAPPLDIPHWIKGEEVTEFEPGKVYVIEFWATWCGPCLAAMPHLSDLQDEYADYGVRIIGVSNEPVQTIVGLLTRTDNEDVLWGDKIRYAIATDPKRATQEHYMRAAEQNFIPTAFIVGKTGLIEWIGSPRNMDEVLYAVVHDQWDREPAREKHLREAKAQRRERIRREMMSEARTNEDWETLLALIDEQIEAADGNPRAMFQRFASLLADVKSYHAGYGYGERLVDKGWDDPQLLNAVAWFVATDERIGRRDLDFARRAAQRAVELTDESDAAILDTLARVHYEQGSLDEALKWQRLAVEHSQEGPMADEMREALEKYEAEAAAG